MSKRRILFLLELMLVICFSGCGSKKETGGENVTKGSDLSEFVKVDELHSTDAKFYKGKVVTGVDGYLTLLSADGKIEKKYDDVPLADINKIFETIQNKIEEGNIRNIYAIRFGYCCYIGENDEDVLFPIWQIECDYYYNPKEKTKEYKEDLEAAPIARSMYRTMIVNAQTAEFMDPVELKENLLICPNIITWEDVK